MRPERHGKERRRTTFRGRELKVKQLDRIREIIVKGQGRTRQDLAREVCRQFGWHGSNGAWAVRAVVQLLRRLDERGVIRLPPPRRAQGRPRREAIEAVATGLDPAGSHLMTKPLAGGQAATLVVRPVAGGELLMWRAHMERFHYLGDAALVGESLRYVAELDGELAALLSWGAAALRNGPRDRHVGWDEEARMANLHLVANNARFLILPWTHQVNLASRVLAANLRRLSRDWLQVYGHPLVLAETFVDTSRFRGTCYRAANWVCVGETRGWSKSGQTYRFNGQPKSVWLYPLVREFKTQLCGAPRQCARREGFMVVDVDRLQLYGRGGLFEIIEGFPDCRKRRGIRHRIESVLTSALCAVLAGSRSFVAIAEWATEQSADTLKRLGSKRGKPPSERTYRRVLHSIDVEELDRRTGDWMAEQQRIQAGAGLALDGKTVRGSSDGQQAALHLLSAIVHGSGTVVAQTAVDSKTNEITKVAPLLEKLDMEGTVVTADALLCQREIARHLVEDKQADYVFTVKDNQPTLRQDISEQFVSERHDAERLQRARNPRSRASAFPPSAPHSGQGSRSHRDA